MEKEIPYWGPEGNNGIKQNGLKNIDSLKSLCQRAELMGEGVKY
jgi:hypothetical protein